MKVVAIEGKGRGVIATRDVAAGEVIETAPVVPFDGDLPEELSGLPFDWGNYEAIVLGLTQLVNHDDDPNCEVIRDLDGLTVELIAKRDIRAGEELSHSYKCPLWFTPGRGE